MQAAIKSQYGIDSPLRMGAGGIFEVFINGQSVYSNQTTFRFPSDEEIFALIDSAKR